MRCASAAIILVGIIAHSRFTSEHELTDSGAPSHSDRRTFFSRSDLEDQTEHGIPTKISSSNPHLYKLRPPSSKTMDPFLRPHSDNFLSPDLDPSYSQERSFFDFFRSNGETLQPNDEISSEMELMNASEDEDDSNRAFNVGQRQLFKKRPQINGLGLLGALKGQKLFMGTPNPRPKGLVLSIDLGIKALRDAIMHAKVQQQNRLHEAQAQRNMRLLHNIGKRTVDTSIFPDRT